MNEEIEPPQSRGLFSKLSHFLTGEPSHRADIVDMLKAGFERGLIDSESYSIIQGGLTVSEMKVRDIMIPRSQMVVVENKNKLCDILPPIIESQHSRFPVVGEDSNEVLGVLLAKDLLPFLLKPQQEIDLNSLIRPASFIPQSKRLNALLKDFQESKSHMAIVVDEYGSVDGLVTIEDVLEQIVGEIEDEHDFEDEHFIKHAKHGNFLVKAVTPVKEFNQHFTAQFDEDEFDTIGGLVIHEFGRLPKRHEQIKLGDFHFRVLNSDNRTVRLLQVSQDMPAGSVKSYEFG